ncbi:hypothetical protein EYF80_015994 [Liparis tanakae]|uniref:Uncharacterized protein n=1 Tax=Liparis tanakae TaxID=230148 RepID=A0A4Z2I6V3_9TELE|nr:hypothetical protein EYF80_015994 [Liparis tanakae]
MRVFGPGGLAALFLVQTRPVSRFLLGVTVIQEVRLSVLRVALLPPVIACAPRVGMSWLAERSPSTRLVVLRPSGMIAASSIGGMMLSPVVPVVAWTATGVRGPAVEPRGSQQGSSGLAFGEIGAHRSLSVAR